MTSPAPHLLRTTTAGSPTWLALACLTLACSTLGACVDNGEAEFVISEVERHQECLTAASPIVPSMFAARKSLDGVGLFMQTEHRLASVSDLVYIEVYQPEVVRARLGEPIELSDPLELIRDDEEFDEAPIARGVLMVAETCPDLDESFGLRGTVVFDRLEVDDGDFVEGELSDVEILSVRDEVVVGRLDGTWRFEVDQARPIEFYPTPPDEMPEGRAP